MDCPFTNLKMKVRLHPYHLILVAEVVFHGICLLGVYLVTNSMEEPSIHACACLANRERERQEHCAPTCRLMPLKLHCCSSLTNPVVLADMKAREDDHLNIICTFVLSCNHASKAINSYRWDPHPFYHASIKRRDWEGDDKRTPRPVPTYLQERLSLHS